MADEKRYPGGGGKEQENLQTLVQQKLELVNKVRELRVEIGRVNTDLAKAGADAALIACW